MSTVSDGLTMLARADFVEYKKFLGLKKKIRSDWIGQENDILLKPFMSEDESKEKDVTYIGLRFQKPTDGHKYKTQTDTIYFVTEGAIEVSYGDVRKVREFLPEDAVEIPPHFVRKLIPRGKSMEIELIVKPRFDPKDEVHVYD